MNVYDIAHDLARAVKDSQEMTILKKAMADIESNADAKQMLDDFRQRQADVQRQIMSGETPASDEMENMEKLYEIINMNPTIRNMLEAERRLSIVMEDIQRILSEPLKEIYLIDADDEFSSSQS